MVKPCGCCVLCDLLNYGQVNADPAKKDQISVRVHDVRAVTGECSICSNEDEMLFALSMSCMHMPQMCKMCASRHLDGAFVRTLSAGMQDMICPVLGCKVLQRYPCCVFAMCNHAWQVVLTEEEIRRSIGDQKSNWEKRLSAGIQSSFDMVQCATPNCCGSYFKEDMRDRVSFLCVYCEQSTCVECLTLVHPGRTCSENMAVLQISDDLGSDVQKCPKCRAPAVKDGEGDCDRLICTQCKPPTPFCAKCSAPYDGEFGIRKTDNSAHEPSCKHYSTPEEGKPPAYSLRRAAEASAKSRRQSSSPPRPSQVVVWSIITADDSR
jgi:hypothetical protein